MNTTVTMIIVLIVVMEDVRILLLLFFFLIRKILMHFFNSFTVLICCDFCQKAYHEDCISSAADSLPNPWKCHNCTPPSSANVAAAVSLSDVPQEGEGDGNKENPYLLMRAAKIARNEHRLRELGLSIFVAPSS